MRNITRVGFITISAILLAACSAKTPSGTETRAGKTNTDTEQSQKASLKELLALGKNQKCTISTSTTGDDGLKTDTTGIVYISGKNMAEEITVTSTDKQTPTINMRTISDGTYVYTWNLATKAQGMKIKMTDPSDGGVQNQNGQAGGADMDNKFDMKCSAWIVDNSKFTLPTDVQFTDLSEMMKNIPTMPANIPSADK